jgi:hypothetical protein
MSGTNHIKPVKKRKIADPLKLTGADILGSAVDYKEEKKVVFEDGRYTTVLVNFSPIKIAKLLEDFGTFVVEYEQFKKEGNEEYDVGNIIDFLNLFVVLYFSTLAVKIPKTIQEKLDMFLQFMEHDVVEQIFDAFKDDQISKVYETFFKRIEEMQKIIKGNKKLREDLKVHFEGMELENKDIIRNVLFSDSDESVENTEVESGDLIG